MDAIAKEDLRHTCSRPHLSESCGCLCFYVCMHVEDLQDKLLNEGVPWGRAFQQEETALEGRDSVCLGYCFIPCAKTILGTQ